MTRYFLSFREIRSSISRDRIPTQAIFLVFGRETEGLPESLLKRTPTVILTIPMHGTRSLNVATAVAILIHFRGRDTGSNA